MDYDESKSSDGEKQTTAQGSHPSESQAVRYHDPNAPKAERKLRWEKLVLFSVVLLLFIGLGLVAYVKIIKNNIAPSAVNDYSGGLAESAVPENQITKETEVARKFLQAVQAHDADTVEQLASASLKQSVQSLSESPTPQVISLYTTMLDGIDVAALIASVPDPEAAEVRVVFTDTSHTQGSTGTYKIEAGVVTENNELKVTGITTNLSL
jgi:hypothetical protein